MTVRTRAVVLWAAGGPLSLEGAELAPPCYLVMADRR